MPLSVDSRRGEFYTPRDLRRILGLNYGTFQQWVNDGLRILRFENGVILIYSRDLLNFMMKNKFIGVQDAVDVSEARDGMGED